MAAPTPFSELTRLLKKAGIEIRIEPFKNPPDSAGGLCKMRGRNLVLLSRAASEAERTQALIEVVERLGLEQLGVAGSDLSPELLARFNRRGQMPWPHKREAPSVAKTHLPASPSSRTVPSTSKFSASDSMHTKKSVPLAPLTTMGVGGPASKLVKAHSEEEVREAVKCANEAGEQVFVLGGGSNVVIADRGVTGTVLQVAVRGIEQTSVGDDVLVSAGAGENWHEFAKQMTLLGLSGVECLGGIPGAVGATPIQNVGAYGQEVSQTIESVRALDQQDLSIRIFSAEECEFSYRDSYFKSRAPGRYVVLQVTFRLKKGGAPSLRYGELSKVFEGRATAPSLEEVFLTVVALRKEKSMVLDPSDENTRSCGSFFVNAQVTGELVDHIESVAGKRPPAFPTPDGLFKVPSAWLIEQAGLTKGLRRGNVGLSTKHTLSVVAHEGATALEVVQFAHFIRNTVEDKYGVRLIPEPHFWGFHTASQGLPIST